MSDMILHQDVWFDIFLRLPIKTLVTCACTCKSFKSYITNPHFIAAHRKKSKDNPYFFLRYYDAEKSEKEKRSTELYGLHPDDNDDGDSWDFNMRKLPLKTHARCFHILGSCNGVICLSDDVEGYTNRIYLWNPCIKKYIPLSCPNVIFPTHGPYEMRLGFGFDDLANDFKVVRVVYLDGNYYGPPLVEVYSVKVGSWRYVEINSPPKLVIHADHAMQYSQCFFKGAIHWLGKKCFPMCLTKWAGIVSFNLVDECFGEMELPSCLDRTRENLTISTCWGMLAVIHHVNSDYSSPSLHDYKICVWAMKEYGVVGSWTQMFTLTNSMTGLIFKQTISFRKNKDVLMLSCKGRVVSNGWPCHVICSVKQNGSMIKELGKYFGSLGGFYLDLYEESLALFDEGKATLSTDEVVDDVNAVRKIQNDEAEELHRRITAMLNSGQYEVRMVQGQYEVRLIEQV